MNRAPPVRPPAARRARDRAGVVLVLVLVAIALLSLAAYTFSQWMFAEREAAWVAGRGAQARALTDSGVAWIEHHLTLDPDTLREAGGLYENPDLFRGVLVADGDQGRDRGRFTVVAPEVRDGAVSGIRFGLENESTRLNLNTLLVADERAEDGGREILMALPGMTEELADTILDWIDPDDDVRQFGAERDYYSGLDPPYSPRNGPLETVEELLLVRGVSPWLLFGPDADRNGSVDGHEGNSAVVAGVDNSDHALDHGWQAHLTLYSLESNLRPDGQPRMDLNADDLEKLHQDLTAVFPADWATFIIAYRQGGPYSGNLDAQSLAGGELDLSKPGTSKLTTVLDLIGVKVQATFKGFPSPVVLESPFPDAPLVMDSYLPILLDYATINPAATIPGRININQASRTVLLGIPGMDVESVERIIAERELEPTEDQPGRRHETWLLSEGLVTLDEMKQLMPLVTGGGSVYRAQVIGYFDQSGPAARAEVVVDAATAAPRLVFIRDLSHLGRGYAPETLGIEADVRK